MKRHYIEKFIISIICIFAFDQVLNAQEYRIGAGDVLEFVFWQRPDLTTRVTVDQNGAVIVPIIGTIQVANLTSKNIEELVLSQIRFYDSRVTKISLNILEYNSTSFVITGQVRNPGKYGFTAIPSLWDLIARSGGPAADADLREVTIIRKVNNPVPKDSVIRINLVIAMSNNELSDLPTLKPGDMIFVPGRSRNLLESGTLGSLGSSWSSSASINRSSEIILIMGEVNRPGIIPFVSNMTLLEAVVTAGGPTRNAKLKEIRVIREQKGIIKISKVNLGDMINKSDLQPYFLRQGDTIILLYKRSFRESFGFELIRATLFGAITSFLYLYFRENI